MFRLFSTRTRMLISNTGLAHVFCPIYLYSPPSSDILLASIKTLTMFLFMDCELFYLFYSSLHDTSSRTFPSTSSYLIHHIVSHSNVAYCSSPHRIRVVLSNTLHIFTFSDVYFLTLSVTAIITPPSPAVLSPAYIPMLAHSRCL